jgi:hypothetical protein
MKWKNLLEEVSENLDANLAGLSNIVSGYNSNDPLFSYKSKKLNEGDIAGIIEIIKSGNNYKSMLDDISAMDVIDIKDNRIHYLEEVNYVKEYNDISLQLINESLKSN